MSKWQLIETAPKDKDVIVFDAHKSQVRVAFWGVDPSDGGGEWVFGRFFVEQKMNCLIVVEPTHWMPIPLPPTKGETS